MKFLVVGGTAFPLCVCPQEHPAAASMENGHFHCMVSNQEERTVLKTAADLASESQLPKYILGAEETAQRLVTLAAPAEDLSSGPCTHIWANNCLLLQTQRIRCLFWPQWVLNSCGQTHSHTHICLIKNKNKILSMFHSSIIKYPLYGWVEWKSSGLTHRS